MNVGARVRIALALMGRDPAWLVRESGVGPHTIRDVLSGQTRSPLARTLEKMAALLGVPSSWLCADAPPRKLTETEHEELLQSVEILRRLALGPRTDVRATASLMRETKVAVTHQFKARGAREVYRVQGACMSGFGFVHGDLVYVKPLSARFAMRSAVGSFVVFRLNDVLHLRQLTVATHARIVMRGAHPGCDPLTIDTGDKFEPVGQIVASVRTFEHAL